MQKYDYFKNSFKLCSPFGKNIFIFCGVIFYSILNLEF
ncbi:hypothetical protein CHAB381_0429 [Campylobacter hominis ATCC BAA-381]|uniref:Uncharacterized protein n=1 Tax=Campylobacter hominis (strain ATCC BAA-381 / DSM 21671 / CCUG 45161 / LMG 19568 / NCTC 13146 / CH001A) TaxID=360107 RepID=A7I0I4_CAMHC|nr:hypothetical protein CHAB381_0429 [Campylobacter hominis ATCC BAA-381]